VGAARSACPTRRHTRFAPALLARSVALAAGCGGSTPAPPQVAVPTNLAYPVNPAIYLVGTAITVFEPTRIAAFTATPAVAPMGSAALLEWVISGAPPNSLTLDGVDVLGQASRPVTPRRHQTYTLQAGSISGSTQATVTVVAQGLELLAGNLSGPGWADGAAEARFNQPSGVAADTAGNVFVADLVNQTIHKVTPAGHVTTLRFSADGVVAMAFGANGTLYAAEGWGQTIMAIDTVAQTATVVVGTPGLVGNVTGPFPGGLAYPSGVAVTAQGDLLVSVANAVVLVTAP
jgi:NHL repeat